MFCLIKSAHAPRCVNHLLRIYSIIAMNPAGDTNMLAMLSPSRLLDHTFEEIAWTRPQGSRWSVIVFAITAVLRGA